MSSQVAAADRTPAVPAADLATCHLAHARAASGQRSVATLPESIVNGDGGSNPLVWPPNAVDYNADARVLLRFLRNLAAPWAFRPVFIDKAPFFDGGLDPNPDA